MASIESNRAAGNAARASGILKPVAAPIQNAPPALPLNPYPAPNTFMTAPLPSISTQLQDAGRNWQTGTIPQDRIVLVPPASNAQVGSQTGSIIQVIGNTTGGSGIILKTNNQNNAVQSILNLLAGTNISLSSDAHGGVTITGIAAATSTPQWPLPNTSVAFYAEANVSSGFVVRFGAVTALASSSAGSGSAGSGNLPTATDGTYAQITVGSGPTSNSAFGYAPGISATAEPIFWAGRNCQYQCRARFPSSTDITNGQVYYGFTNQIASQLRTGDNSPPVYIVAIVANFGTWEAMINNNGTVTTTTISNTPDTNTHDFAVVMNDTLNTTTFYIDSSEVAIISGHNPSGIGFWPTFALLNASSGGGVANQNLQYIFAQQSF